MPRDDLSIDFVRKMPQAEPLDPGLILDDWINRVQNLPEEIRFCHEEITDKDRQYNECIRIIEDRDAKIQKWIKSNGSHEPNPKEDALRATIRENYSRADQLAAEKLTLTQKLQVIMDKHIRALDVQVKLLFDRSEPGFTNPDEVPSLLRPSAANHSAPLIRVGEPGAAAANGPAASPGVSANGIANPALSRIPPGQLRIGQPQQHAASAPTSPAASMILNRNREGSAGPTPKRVGRANTSLGAVPAASSGLARHASLGPGTPKAAMANGTGGVVRSGSAGPRASSVKGGSAASARRGTPNGGGRKKAPSKSSLSRVKKASNRNSPASTVDSDLSDAASGSELDDGASGRSRGTPARDGKDADGDDILADVDDDDEDGSDDKKYCTCQNVSFGDMVACEPNGTWYCPICRDKVGKKPT